MRNKTNSRYGLKMPLRTKRYFCLFCRHLWTKLHLGAWQHKVQVCHCSERANRPLVDHTIYAYKRTPTSVRLQTRTLFYAYDGQHAYDGQLRIIICEPCYAMLIEMA